eukprot:gnl/MRDRNA2_/MRDRNA2_135015_c0_seq1.p1 gnl/MRDRNA2_/MRDRNA2_135015_c0~~gnl/MRDRNA2_/MRDRNA2_135015_c0_seq1.p1  ORF type:complete len:929 (-),score=209.92 gnl/MRDRNA2_/MRDRNA2_135015_c0_seq1:200-2986(-)
MLAKAFAPPHASTGGPGWLPSVSEGKRNGGSSGAMKRPMSAPSLNQRQGNPPRQTQTRYSRSGPFGSQPANQGRPRPSTASSMGSRSSVILSGRGSIRAVVELDRVKPGSVKDLTTRLDAMTAPSLLDLRQNNQNIRKRLQQEGLTMQPYKVPPLDRLRMEIREMFNGRDWDFLETIQVVEFRDALEHKCGVPSGTFRNNTFMRILSEEVQRHRAYLLRVSAENAEFMAQQSFAEDAAGVASPTAGRAGLQFDDAGVDSPTSPKSPAPTPKAGGATPKEKPENCEALWASTFHRLKIDGELHTDNLQQALELIGFQKPDQSWIDDITRSITKYSTVSISEFSVFVKKFKEKQREFYKEVFSENDKDASGFVDRGELRDLLRTVGIVPLPAVLEQVMEEVDEDLSGTVGFEEFEKVMEIMRVREGFTKQEITDFDAAFKKFDRDLSGEVDTNELQGILGWLGYSQDSRGVHQVVKKVDIDGSGSVSQEEFLVCMRYFRTEEVDKVTALMAANDQDGSGTISSAELRGLLHSLGYHLSPDVLREVAADAGCESKAEMTFDDIWTMIGLFRMREGFLRAEVEDLRQAFKKYDKRGSGEIDCVDLGHVLRWLGFSPSLQEQQLLVADVDIDKSGLLDFSEFMKLMRKKREAFFTKMHEAFCCFERDRESDRGTGFIVVANLTKALRKVGVFKLPPDVDLQDKPSHMHITDFEGFVKMVKQSHEIDRDIFRRNAGFSDETVKEYKQKFELYDKDNSGDISNKELQHLLLDLYPDQATNKDSRPKFLKLMEAVDADKNGRLDFGDFLRLNRQYQTELENDRIMKEQAAIEQTGFDSDEVEEYRVLFQEECVAVKSRSHIPVTNILTMINSIAPLGSKQLTELKRFISTVNGDGDAVDFAQFLQIIKHVQEVNVAGINEKAAEKVRTGSWDSSEN